MNRFVSGILAIVAAVGFLVLYAPLSRSYDPEKVCAEKHPQMPREQCLAQINFALSAGW